MRVNMSVCRRAPRAFALVAALALVSNNLFVAAAQVMTPKTGAQKLTEEQRVVHVLNRLGFGARPGEVERVRRLGLEAYIEQQLNPSKLDDSALAARLRDFPTLGMSNGELLAKYPQPGQLLRRLERAGELPPELAALVRQRNQGQPNNAASDERRAGRRREGHRRGDAPARHAAAAAAAGRDAGGA